MAVYTFKDGELRLYDGTTPTPYYYVVDFAEAVSGWPISRARPEENLILDREQFTSLGHYVQGPDAPILEPIDLQLTAKLDSVENRQKLLQALTVGTVGANAWTSTKGSTQLTAGDGSLVTTPAFADSQKKTVNIEVLWTVNATSIGYRWAEVWFDPAQIQVSESMDGVSLQATGRCYGAISEITSFTAGNAS